jgi:tetratricopeptide (TPR) repeat protein/tRNA A-37 threonylcarbamoyl transferase component Bud32/class 3 adenylate cyclase
VAISVHLCLSVVAFTMIGKTISHYRILEKLGSGGMGVVYKAEDIKLERHVALKFLPQELSTEEKRRKRFILEAKSASSLDHPNLCTIHEIDQTQDGQMFIAMSFYEGETLRDKISSGMLRFSDAIDIATQIANGLAKAHSHGIVHRDIKPANIMITKSGLVKILDFGLAKLTGSSEITEAGTTVGTISYMSPEQAFGHPIDHRTDIWSWGVVFHEMVTGMLPFPSENALHFLQVLVARDPVMLRESLPLEVRRVLAKSLAKNINDRYNSISEAVEDLRLVKTTHAPTLTVASTAAAAPTMVVPGETGITARKAEKKPLTFLVAGISGYSELLEQLPFGQIKNFQQRLESQTEALTAKFGGVLNEFDPDRIVILFGIPIAQENDFVSAVQLAFDLQRSAVEIGTEIFVQNEQLIALQSGIHSGLVVMQPSVRGKCKYEIAGAAFQTAVTLALNARPNEILITAESKRLTRHMFVSESRDGISIPGMTTPSNAYAVLTDSSQAEEAFLAPYTGRDKELTVLQNCLERSTAGEGQFVTLVGEAGVGKSRLFAEFKRMLNGSVRCLEGRCFPSAATVPYAPFRDLIIEALHLHKIRTPEEVAQKIREIDPALEDFIPLYLHLLSMQSEQFPFPRHLEGENLRLAILDALSGFVLTPRAMPVVLLLEDWHWADEASQNAVKQIVEMLPEQACMAVVSYRPDASIDWSGTMHHTRLYLEPLEAKASKVLMQSIFEVETVSDSLAELIYDRSGGNPFFVEEICLTLKEEAKIKVEQKAASLESSPDKIRLPETIQALILSRLDRLDRATRDVLQTAAVIGREFSRTIFQRVSGNQSNLASSLGSLKNLGLIQQLRVLPEPLYKFRNALTQEVAYDSLIASEKKRLHHAVAQAIEELYEGRLEEYYEQLAQHFSKADSWAKAVQYGIASAQRANDLGQFSESLQILEQAEQWLAKLTGDSSKHSLMIDLMLRQERLFEILGIRDRQEQILNDLLSLLKRTNDQAQQIEVYRRQGELLTVLARFDSAEAALNESLKLSQSLQDQSGERNAFRSIGFLKWHQGLNEEAVANNQKALEIDRSKGDVEALAADLSNLGSVLRDLGDYKAGLECLEEALRIYETITHPVKHAAALHLASNLYREVGNHDQAINYLQRAMELSTRYRLVIMQSFHLNSIANMYWQQGKQEECLNLHKQAVDLNRKSRYADGLSHALRMVGETLQSMQRDTEAIPYLEEAASLFVRLKDPRNEANMQKKLAEIYEATAKNCREKADLPGAITNYYEAVNRYENLGEPGAAAAILNSIGILLWKSGNYDEALAVYERALEIFQSLGDQVHAGLILNSIGLTLKNLGRNEEARTTLEEARAVNQETKQKRLEGHSVAALADLHSDAGEIDAAMKLYEAALQIKRDTNDSKGEAWMLYHLARLEKLAGHGPSEDYMIEAEKLVIESEDQKLKEAWNELQLRIRKGGNRA